MSGVRCRVREARSQEPAVRSKNPYPQISQITQKHKVRVPLPHFVPFDCAQDRRDREDGGVRCQVLGVRGEKPEGRCQVLDVMGKVL